jgi:hypothetical protein
MKKAIVIIALLLSNFMFAQSTTEEAFKNSLQFIMKDAATGFKESKGEFSSKSFGTTYNFSKTSFFSKNASIGYTRANYLPASKVTIPEAYFFYQGFVDGDENDKFVYNNAERIFDEIMVMKKLKKKILKQDKYHKDKDLEIDYVDKNKRIILAIKFDIQSKITRLYIYSDLRPGNLPKYFGCLIMYNVQSNTIASANTYYVYGSEFKGAEYLYNAIRSKMDATSQRLFSKYEWKPNAGKKQIFELLQSLNLRENGSSVDPDGNFTK